MHRLHLIILALCLAVPLQAGVIYEFRMKSQGDAATMRGEAKVEGPRMRLELEEGDGVVFRDGSIVISEDRGSTMMVLDPKKKQFYRLSIEESVGAMRAMLSSMGGMVEMSVSDQKVEVERLGPGEAIDGYPTTKYRIDADYTLNLKALGMDMSQRIRSETTSWTTDRLDRELASFLAFRTLRTGIEGLDELIEKQTGVVSGFPLKTVTRSEITARGRTSTSTTTMTVTNIREAEVPASEFTVPDGYREVDGPLAALQRPR